MVKCIVYESNSGFTKKYAELLSSKTGIPISSLSQAKNQLPAGAEILFMGWIMAGSIKGFEKAGKLYSVKAVCAVGMASAEDDKQKEDLKKRYALNGTPLFYLQGGFDMNKLKGIYKLMMKMMGKVLSASIEKKEHRTAEDQKMLDMLKYGGDCVCEENLTEVLAFLEQNR